MQPSAKPQPIKTTLLLRMRAHNSDFPVYFLLLVFTLLLFPSFLIGKTLYWGDILLYFSPMQAFAQTSLKSGVVPLWNPYLYSGQPFVGNPQMSVFYPTTLLLFFFPNWLALNVTIILHLFLCGLFTYILLKRWKCGKSAAFCGAAIYLGGSCLMGRVQFPPVIQTAAYFPLLLYFVDRFILNRAEMNRKEASIDKWALPGVTMTVALSLLAAHTQTAFLIYLCVIGFSVFRFWEAFGVGVSFRSCSLSPKTANSFRLYHCISKSGVGRPLFQLLGAALFGVLLSSVFLFPTFQLLKESSRERMTLFQANRFYMDFPHLMTILFPHFAGHPGSGDYFARGNAWEPAIFVGWTPLVFIVIALLKQNRTSLASFWMASSLLGIWLAMGVNLGLFALAFYLIPGLSSFHDPARFLLWTSFGFATLAALGLERFFRAANPRNWLLKAGVILTILIPLIWFGGEWNPTTPPQSLIGSLTQRKELQELAQNGRFESVGYNLLWKRFVDFGYNDFKTEESGFQLKQMQDSLLSNQEMNYQLETSTGYEPVPIVSTLEMTGLSRRAQLRNEPNYSRLLSMMNVSVILQAQPSQIADARIEPVKSDEQEHSLKRKALRLSLNRDRLPRAWLVRKTRNVLGKTRLAAAIAAPDFQPEREAIVSTEQGDKGYALEWGSVDFKNVPVKPVAWEILSPTQIRLIANADKAPAFLVYSMALIPGWHGSLDGKPVPLLRADEGLLGMLIPAGKHTINIDYRPNAFLLGAYLSLSGLGGLVFWCAWLIDDKFVRQNTSLKILETFAAYRETESQ